ncbi:hypothetical protein MKK84_03105 [Methylobacterium sp. E-065]|uniref:hypothetical protein n=1 Tax=Methylobacterium sp. E-065 TaxID=2836583 RepID=UPI001FBBB063|nr:hypothetical protein [Methylobacterium sp. E-065]MCJ2016425.1 hypothetical protein [Methylobacterium sp. E-065]
MLPLLIGPEYRPAPQELIEIDEIGWQTFARAESLGGAAEGDGDALKHSTRRMGRRN